MGFKGNIESTLKWLYKTLTNEIKTLMGIMSGIRPPTVTSIDELERAMKENAIYTETLPLSMESCMKTVGFPEAIIAAKEKRKLRDATVKPFLDSVRSDWAKARRNDRYVKELLGYMLQARGTALSWLSITSDTSLASPHTAQSYIETLERLLVAAVLELILPQGRVMSRKNRKIHFSDPLAYRAFSSFARVNMDDSGDGRRIGGLSSFTGLRSLLLEE